MKAMVRKMFSAVMAIVIVTISCIPAIAVDAVYSSSSTSTVYGRTYTYYSYIENWNGEQLCARIYSEADKPVPIGYMGLQARMYNSNGALEEAADWRYNWIDDCVTSDTYD